MRHPWPSPQHFNIFCLFCFFLSFSSFSPFSSFSSFLNRRKIDRQRSHLFVLDMLRCFSMPHSNFLLLNPEACDSSPRLILENLKTHLRRRRGTLDPEDSVRLGRTRSPTLLTPRDLDSASGIKRRPPRQSNPATDQPHIPRHSRPPYRLVQQHFCCSVWCGNAKIVFLLEKLLERK